jgi:hypothetical protein
MAATLAEAMSYGPFANDAIRLLVFGDMPTVKISAHRYRCDTGEHRWHTSQSRARWCAFAALPMVKL